MKLKQIVDITKILSDRKVPDDVIKFLDYSIGNLSSSIS